MLLNYGDHPHPGQVRILPSSALDGAEGQRANDIALGQQRQDGRGNDGRQEPRCNEPELDALGMLHPRDDHRHRLRLLVGQDQPEKKLVPRKGKADHRCHRDGRCGQGKGDSHEGAEARGPVHQSRLLQLHGQLLEHVAQDQNRKGHDEGCVGHDECPVGVQQPQGFHEQEEGNGGGHGRQEALGEEPQGHVLVFPPVEAEACQAVAGHGAQRDGDQGGPPGDDEAVAQRAGDLLAAGDVLVLPVGGGGGELEEGHQGGLGEDDPARLERGNDGPVEGEEGPAGGDDDHHPDEDISDVVFSRRNHGCASFSRRCAAAFGRRKS